MGAWEAKTPVFAEAPLEYHSADTGTLTHGRDPACGQCQMGSLTGAVASERVTEAPKGLLSMVGNHAKECKGRRRLDCESDNSSRYESRA